MSSPFRYLLLPVQQGPWHCTTGTLYDPLNLFLRRGSLMRPWEECFHRESPFPHHSIKPQCLLSARGGAHICSYLFTFKINQLVKLFIDSHLFIDFCYSPQQQWRKQHASAFPENLDFWYRHQICKNGHEKMHEKQCSLYFKVICTKYVLFVPIFMNFFS